jgi:hypothetical protein
MMRPSNSHEWSLGVSGFDRSLATVEQQDEADGRRRSRDGTGAHSRAVARGFFSRRPQLILVLGGPN